jgi:hypothetical protein
MAFKFTLVRPSDGAKRRGYFGFAWSTLLVGPLSPLARRDFGFSLVLMSSEILICAVVFFLDDNFRLLIARFFVVTLSWALIYNELYVLNLVAAGFQFDGSSEVISALERKFGAAGITSRVRLLRERSLAFVVVGLGCLQAATNLAPQFFNPSDKSAAGQIQPSAAPVTKLTPTPTLSPPPELPPKEMANPAPAPASSPSALPRLAQASPTVQAPPAVEAPPAVQAPPVAQAPPPLPKPVETPQPPVRSTAQILADRMRECDDAMGTLFDSDLPAGARSVVDTSVLSERDIDDAIVSCEAARAGPGRRFISQLGRAYAAKAVLLAAQGHEAEARDVMNKAITQWNAAAAQGSGAAMNFLGAVYKGTFNSPTFAFVQPDYQKALSYWLDGEKAGNLKAARNAGGMLLLGSADFPGITQNIKKSTEFLEKAIRGGDMTAASLYGQALYYGYPTEVKKDVKIGLDLLIQACGSGDPSAKVFFDNEMAKPRKPLQFPTTRPQGC